MKYIRTKDGNIYEYVNVITSQLVGTEIINQADTIEELCDEFVCEGYISEPCLVELRRDKTGIDCLVKGTDDDWFVPESTVETLYGAIWTDKGLIYVAKMNEKGELELL